MMTHSAPTTALKKNLRTAREAGPLSLAQEKLLARRWRQHGDRQAMTLLIRAHLGLVVRIASEFRHAGPPLEDLVQEGNVGLTIAARRFDPDRATRLATYATYWIRACMLEHVVRTHGPVRIGTTRSQRRIFFGLGRARHKLGRTGEPIEYRLLAEELGVDLAELEAMAPRLAHRDIFLDAARGEDDPRTPHASLPHEGPDPEEMCTGKEEQLRRFAQFEAALHQLEPRERDILKLRHLCERPETLAELGKRFGLSRERVRQLEARAKDRMRQLCSGRHPRRLWRNQAPQ